MSTPAQFDFNKRDGALNTIEVEAERIMDAYYDGIKELGNFAENQEIANNLLKNTVNAFRKYNVVPYMKTHYVNIGVYQVNLKYEGVFVEEIIPGMLGMLDDKPVMYFKQKPATAQGKEPRIEATTTEIAEIVSWINKLCDHVNNIRGTVNKIFNARAQVAAAPVPVPVKSPVPGKKQVQIVPAAKEEQVVAPFVGNQAKKPMSVPAFKAGHVSHGHFNSLKRRKAGVDFSDEYAIGDVQDAITILPYRMESYFDMVDGVAVNFLGYASKEDAEAALVGKKCDMSSDQGLSIGGGPLLLKQLEALQKGNVAKGNYTATFSPDLNFSGGAWSNPVSLTSICVTTCVPRGNVYEITSNVMTYSGTVTLAENLKKVFSGPEPSFMFTDQGRWTRIPNTPEEIPPYPATVEAALKLVPDWKPGHIYTRMASHDKTAAARAQAYAAKTKLTAGVSKLTDLFKALRACGIKECELSLVAFVCLLKFNNIPWAFDHVYGLDQTITIPSTAVLCKRLNSNRDVTLADLRFAGSESMQVANYLLNAVAMNFGYELAMGHEAAAGATYLMMHLTHMYGSVPMATVTLAAMAPLLESPALALLHHISAQGVTTNEHLPSGTGNRTYAFMNKYKEAISSKKL